jgi:hypothetical protein
MAPFEQAHWIATSNIARFEGQLKTEADTCQRKFLQGLIVLEQEMLKAIYRPDRQGRSPPPSTWGGYKSPLKRYLWTRHGAEGIDAMNIDKPIEISATKASGGVQLHAMRYVLGISIALAAAAGIILWNIYATH